VGTVELGVGIVQTDLAAGIVDVARVVEQAGLESLFVVEHTHVPASRRDVLEDELHCGRPAFWIRSPCWALPPRSPRA
jgi:alkanesulfonate monooxygenase SsuD/methylene tetrahydromethanopterin reductase-like flavin-dependent oxidoreductase (luciferase family)